MSCENTKVQSGDYPEDDFAPEKRMWQIWGAATGQIPIGKIGEMTPEEKKLFDGIMAGREAVRRRGKHYIYEMPGTYGSSF